MALPSTFQSSFWNPDLRLPEPLWSKLEAGVVENEEILTFINERANCAKAAARALYEAAESKLSKNGFRKDDGASLRRTLEGLKHETKQVAKAHESIANNLDHMILRPFATWSQQHEGRIADMKEQIKEGYNDWDGLSSEVRKLKETRNLKCSQLDEAEDDLRFAPTSPTLTSPGFSRGRSNSATANSIQFAQTTASQAAQAAQTASLAATNLARSLSQRMKVSPTAYAIKTRLERMRSEAKERELTAKGKDTGAMQEEEELVDEEGNRLEGSVKSGVIEQQKDSTIKDADKYMPNLRTDQLDIAGVVKQTKDWSVIFSKAKMQVPTTVIKVPLIGTTPDAHSGEDLVQWFRDNLDDLAGSTSRAHELCRQLSEELSILRLVGELGNKFFDSSDAFYAWRPDAFHLEDIQNQINEARPVPLPHTSTGEEEDQLTQLATVTKQHKSTNSPLNIEPVALPQMSPVPIEKDTKSPLSPSLAGSGLTRSSTLTSYLSSAYEMAASNVSSLNARMGKVGTGIGSDKLERLRKDASESEEAYRIAVRELDDLRMQHEELLSTSLVRAQKLEAERLKAIKSVFTTYNATLASLNTPLQLSSERSALLQESFVPFSDLNSIIERYRTGPFRPKPAVWIDFYHEQTDIRFGIDLKHWRDTHEKEETIPDIVSIILQAIQQGYEKLPSTEERRKTWIYEVSLSYSHRLRNMTNDAASPLHLEDLKKFDLPVLASGLKLWLLELAVSLFPSSMYNDVKYLYPSVGADITDENKRILDILSLLDRLPKTHLVVLDALLSHLKALIDSTTTNEADSDYIGKLGATLGPCILRPSVDSDKTLNDRFPSQFLIDLLKYYPDLLPPTLEKKDKVEEERYAPKRQRTKMIDQRLSRSAMGAQDEKEKERLLKEEIGKRTGSDKVVEEPDQIHEEPKSVKQIARAVVVPKQAQTAAVESARNKRENLEVPLPDGNTSEVERSSGFTTPSEGIESPPSMMKSVGEPRGFLPPSSADDILSDASLPAAFDQGDDLDKPLGTVVSLHRTGTGSSARRVPRTAGGNLGAANSTPVAAGVGTKTRGPRPMSMQMPSATPGLQIAATSPTGSPLPAGPAGVRARAALFEQKTTPPFDSPAAGPGHKATPSNAGAALSPK